MSELTWTPDTARLDSIVLWERNPKTMSKARAERLLRSWQEMGQYQTLAVGPDGSCYDGTQRVLALRAAGYKGDYTLAVRRSNRALTEPERERLVIESTVGTVGMLDWDALAGWDDLEQWGLDAEALAAWNNDAANMALLLETETAQPETTELADNYSRKIEAPTYEPRNEKPVLADLYDDTRTQALITEIDASDLPESEKAFLRIAAQRHTVLHFDRIADYYAHSLEAMQTLMENNALVIIDFEKAIELGFVRMTESIANLVREEYGDDD